MTDIWSQALDLISAKVNQKSFETWFKPTSLFDYSLDDNEIQLEIPNPYFETWLRKNHLELIKNTLCEITNGSDISIKFIITKNRGDGTPPEVRKPSPVNNESKQIPINSYYTFENFVVGGSNQLANAASHAVAEEPGKRYNPLFIYGGVGLGKTHLLHAIGNYVLRHSGNTVIIYMSSENFVNDLVNSIRFGRMESFRSRYRKADLLLIDDIQFIGGKVRTMEEFFFTFNDLYDSNKQIVVTSDRSPKDISSLEERLKSRFEWGLIADIQEPDIETKAAIIKKKADLWDIKISDEVTMYMAANLGSNVREIEGALKRVNMFAHISKNSITIDLVEEILKNYIKSKVRFFSTEEIQLEVANKYGLKVIDLKSKIRRRELVTPRQIAMYLSKKLTQDSLPQIGRKFGGKDHTTVIHSIRKIEEEMKQNKKLAKDIEELKEKLS